MLHKYASPRILFPRTITEALELAASETEAVFWSGGTKLAGGSNRSGNLIELPRVVIALGLVEELSRASRSENSLEIGSMMSLDRLASIGRSALPPGITEALSLIGTRPLRCRATIGGHIARRDRIGDLIPLLQLLEARVEIRYLRESRGRRKPVPSSKKVPLASLEDENNLVRGELLTRISIPTENWNFALIEKIHGTQSPTGFFIFQAVARIEKSVIAEWRMALCDGMGPILRNREMEAALAGRPLPFSVRELHALDEYIGEMTLPWADRSSDRKIAKCLMRGFIRKADG